MRRYLHVPRRTLCLMRKSVMRPRDAVAWLTWLLAAGMDVKKDGGVRRAVQVVFQGGGLPGGGGRYRGVAPVLRSESALGAQGHGALKGGPERP